MGSPTGNVEFLDGGAAIAACGGTSGEPLSGTSADTATCIDIYPAAGSYAITAQYLGNTDTYNASALSPSITQVVNQANTTASVASNQNASAVYQQVTYTATVAAVSPSTGIPTGTVEFFDDGNPIAACAAQAVTFTSSDTATCQVTYSSTGSHSITAENLGNPGAYNASPVSPPITQVVDASNSYTGINTGTLSSANYYLLNGASAGSTTSTDNAYSPGVATTLTSLTFTISAASTTSQTAIVGLIAGSSWSATGLTCTITGGSTLTSCQIPVSVSIPAIDSINIEVVGGVDAITGSWTTTYTQP
jgi:hypothetical protein